ncbi:MAG: DUF4129 domain-containing protein [Caldimonas sp.]
MPSPFDLSSWCRCCVVAAAFAAPLAAAAAEVVSAARPAPISIVAVEAAASAIRADPDMGGMHKQRIWRLKRDDKTKPASASPEPWLVDFARWLAEGGRLLVWLGGAAALAALLVGARRWLAVRGDAALRAGARLPSHVRELDVRPESLPADIGAAVRAAWLAGERRAALSLLYRGSLSRLVHSLAVPIDDASTEGDCVRLARATLPAERSAFVARLVLAWQIAVYGNRPLETATVLALCDEFDRMLPAGVAAPAAES